jgi:hypothetical protein
MDLWRLSSRMLSGQGEWARQRDTYRKHEPAPRRKNKTIYLANNKGDSRLTLRVPNDLSIADFLYEIGGGTIKRVASFSADVAVNGLEKKAVILSFEKDADSFRHSGRYVLETEDSLEFAKVVKKYSRQ